MSLSSSQPSATSARLSSRERFIAATRCQPLERPPVWIMRQAGRYLPEYRALKEKHSFVEMVRTPELATEVTLQPLRRFPLDAAILFSDILIIPEALGQPYHFRDQGGIAMDFALDSTARINALRPADAVAENLSYVADAMRLCRAALGGSAGKATAPLSPATCDNSSHAAHGTSAANNGTRTTDSSNATAAHGTSAANSGNATTDGGNATTARCNPTTDSSNTAQPNATQRNAANADNANAGNTNADNAGGNSATNPVANAGGAGTPADAFADKALLGFAGSPWTLAAYMVEGGSCNDFPRLKALAYGEPKTFHALMEKLSDAVANLLLLKIAAGADAVQIFDSWAALCPGQDYYELSLRWIERVIARLPQGFPVIVFSKGMAVHADAIARAGATVVGLDWSADIAQTAHSLPSQIAVQGNLDPTLLSFAPENIIRAKARLIIDSLADRPGHIFNLGHGILPTARIESVAALVDEVQKPRTDRSSGDS